MSAVQFTVNKKQVFVSSNTPREMSLNAFLRYELCMSGTKAMCRIGGCGSCIVAVKAYRHTTDDVELFSVNSCLVLAVSCHGWDITTIEALGNKKDGYNDIQKRLVSLNGSQCGYCTPGWVMQMYSLLDKHLTMVEIERSFGSNTCRCTGYRPILDTMKSFAVDVDPLLHQTIVDIEDVTICDKTKRLCQRKCSVNSVDSDWSVLSNERPCCHSNGQVIALDYGNNVKYYKVFNENDIFDVLTKEGDDSYMLVDGDTSKGVIENFEYPRVLIDISDVATLKQVNIDQNLILGANICIQDALNTFNRISRQDDGFAYLSQLAKHLEKVAHIPVRNIGSMAGNLMVKYRYRSYQSDIFILLAAAGAMLTIRDQRGNRSDVTMLQFLNTNMRGKLIQSILIPPYCETHIFRSYKVAPRHQNALAIVNAAFLFKMNKQSYTIQEATIVYGNISGQFNYAIRTQNYLKGKSIANTQTIQGAIKYLNQEVQPVEELPKPSAECRKKIAIGMFYRYILSIVPQRLLSPKFFSGAQEMIRPISRGSQQYGTNPNLYPFNKPLPKLEGLAQSAGETIYTNDIPALPRQVFGAFVLSTVQNGNVSRIDASKIMKINGVIDVITPKDLPGKNNWVDTRLLKLIEEEVILAVDIKYYGQPIAIVVAESEELASYAANNVQVIYENVKPFLPVLTATDGNGYPQRIRPGVTVKPKGRGNNVFKIIKGLVAVDFQYHYYLEPISMVVNPTGNLFHVHAGSQWMEVVQTSISLALNIDESKISVTNLQVGGGFGGKITRAGQVSAACSIVAYKHNKPCRFILPMTTNMMAMGKRTGAENNYELAVDSDGRIQYLKMIMLSNKGITNNDQVTDYIADSLTNGYNADNWEAHIDNIITDLPTNTFMRSPATLQAITTIENIMEHISYALNKDPLEVRLNNLQNEIVRKNILDFKKETDYDARKKAIAEFNRANRWMKKAIVLNHMSYPLLFLQNYHVLVTVYRDGSITITSAGIDLGQGLNTKVSQICAFELGVDVDRITVLPNFTYVASNAGPTVGSFSTESVGYATIKACEQLRYRLEPIKGTLTNPTWEELIAKAAAEEINLSSLYMISKNDSIRQDYNIYGVAVLEVQLDVLFGTFEILRVDILEDTGISINPLIDIGQVEGAFIQGIGLFTSEKLVYERKTGRLVTNNSLTYHVPLALDIPIDFRIKLINNNDRPRGVLGSKVVSEMSIAMSYGVGMAIRRCIMESRRDSGYNYNEWIHIDTPYDTESILKALAVKPEELIFN